MDKDRYNMVEMLFNLTLEIIFLLTGEDYTIVKKPSGECVQASSHASVSEGLGKVTSLDPRPPAQSFLHDTSNKEKILELTNKITELLTGEVPIRCQDVTVYFSMEEWEYIIKHKDQYKDTMLKNHPTITSPALSGRGIAPVRLSPVISQDCAEETRSVSMDHQSEYVNNNNLKVIIKEETNVNSDQEDTPTYNCYDDCTRGPEEQLYFLSDHKAEDGGNTEDTYEEPAIILDIPSVFNIIELSSDHFKHEVSPSDISPITKETTDHIEIINSTIERNSSKFPHSECGKTFLQRSTVGKHQRTHTGGRPFACPQCGKRFMRKPHLIQHLKIHTGVKPYSCSECGKCFGQKSDLVKHQRVHTGEKPYSCSECGKCFSQTSAVIGHLRTHTREKPFSCSECKKCFTRKSDLEKHQQIHTDKRPFSCSQSTKGYSRKSAFVNEKCLTEENLLNVQTVENVLPQVWSSAKTFNFEDMSHDLSQTMKPSTSHSGNKSNQRPEKCFSCSECGKYFSQKSDLVKHQTLHTREKPFPCSECGKWFMSKSQLAQHLKTHTRLKPFSCSDCEQCFTQESELVDHQKLHLAEKPFLCPECGKCFYRKSHLTQHRKIHSGEKPFSCPDCGKSFTQRSDLVKHHRIHTGEKPFSCTICGKRFNQKSAVIDHQRIHTGEKRFTCSDCGRRFNQRSIFVQHQRIHTLDELFQCSECGQCFSKKAALVKHQRDHIRENQFIVQSVSIEDPLLQQFQDLNSL